ncbi:MAG: chorismate synthase [Duncaniella sp.]|nr:chorismate synthase [Duncaniella sp.]
MDSTGSILALTTFGESHGPAMGGVLSGVPSGSVIDLDMLQAFVDRRRASGPHATARHEADRVEILSGIYDGKTLGTPVGFIIRNSDVRSADYAQWADAYRPGHADYTYEAKYGIRDWRGGGRASARETVARVVAGGIAMQILDTMGVNITARVAQIGSATCEAEMNRQLDEARAAGDSLGGIVACTISGVPAGVGEPVFGKLQSRLASAMLSIPAAKGFDYGMGFAGAAARGSEVIDPFLPDFSTAANHSGGIQGGISNGADIYFRVAFKPVATMMRPIDTVDRHGNPVTVQPRGRHDVCVVPRAVVVVESMAALTMLDAILLNRSSRL